MEFDSRPDTYAHIGNVRYFLGKMISGLLVRAQNHDRSKLYPPEREAFDQLPGRLGDSKYPSQEYRDAMKTIKPALTHHYQHNSHHPEHFENGIRGMNILDVVEMLADWKAASLRQKDGDFAGSIAYNQGRFLISDELTAIFLNSVPLFEEGQDGEGSPLLLEG